MKNLHKHYYKDYFERVDFLNLNSESNQNYIKDANKILTQKVSKTDLYVTDLGEAINTEIKLMAQYPGLVTGVGIQHEVSIKGEFKLGMHFDYTSGLPIIYGSTVKGVLKSYFMDEYNNENVDINALIEDIFKGKDYNDKATSAEKRASKSVYDRDIFFDAIIIEPNKDGKILESDALAPHGGNSHDNPFAEPTPLPFIKIAPEVTLLFRFKLNDTKEGDKVVMSVADKKELFEKILTKYGIGAKTNVGYGQLKSLESLK